jgi:hypothetical protein
LIDKELDIEPVYKKLPHDEYGWNRFDGIYRDNPMTNSHIHFRIII